MIKAIRVCDRCGSSAGVTSYDFQLRTGIHESDGKSVDACNDCTESLIRQLLEAANHMTLMAHLSQWAEELQPKG